MKRFLSSCLLGGLCLILFLTACTNTETPAVKDELDLSNAGKAGDLYTYVSDLLITPHYSVTYASDEEYYITAYNSKGESAVEYSNQDISLYLNNGTGVHVSDDIIVRPDVDNLAYVKEALRRCILGKAELVGSGDGEQQYLVTIDGYEAARDFYVDLIGEDEAQTVFSGVDGVPVTLIFAFIPDEEQNSWFIDFSIEINGNTTRLWVIVDSMDMQDWTFGEYDWYEYSFEDPELNALMLVEAQRNISEAITGSFVQE